MHMLLVAFVWWLIIHQGVDAREVQINAPGPIILSEPDADVVVNCGTAGQFVVSISTMRSLTVNITASDCSVLLDSCVIFATVLVLASPRSLFNVTLSVHNTTMGAFVTTSSMLDQCSHCVVAIFDTRIHNASGVASGVLRGSTSSQLSLINVSMQGNRSWDSTIADSHNASVTIRALSALGSATFFGGLCSNCVNSTVTVDSFTSSAVDEDAWGYMGQDSIDSVFQIFNVNLALGGAFFQDVAHGSTACVVTIENVTGFNANSTSGTFQRVGAMSSDTTIFIRRVVDGNGLQSVCRMGTRCTAVVRDVVNVSYGFTLFGESCHGDCGLFVKAARNVTSSFSLACYNSINCSTTFTDVMHSVGSWSLLGFLARNGSFVVANTSEVSECFSNSLAGSGNSQLLVQNSSNMTNCFLGSAGFTSEANGVFDCSINPTACSVLNEAQYIPCVNATVLLHNVTGLTMPSYAETLQKQLSVPYLSIAARIELNDVSRVTGSFAAFLSTTQTAECQILQTFAAFSRDLKTIFQTVFGPSGNPCDRYPASSSLILRGGDESTVSALNGTARSGVNVSLAIQPSAAQACNLVGLLPGVTGGTVEVVDANACLTSLTVVTASPSQVTVTSSVTGLAHLALRGPFSVTLSATVTQSLLTLNVTDSAWMGNVSLLGGGNLGLPMLTYLDVSRNRIRDVDTLLALLTAAPQVTWVAAEGNTMSGTASLKNFDSNAVVSRHVVLADGGYNTATSNGNVAVSYTCGEAATATVTVWRATRLTTVGGWNGWDPATTVRFPGPSVGPCACNAGVTWDLTSGSRWPCHFTRTATLTPSAASTVTLTANVTPSLTASKSEPTVVQPEPTCDLATEVPITLLPALLSGAAMSSGATHLVLTLMQSGMRWASGVSGAVRLTAGPSDTAFSPSVLGQLRSDDWSIRAAGAVLNITLGAAPGLRIVGGDNATLLIVLGEGAFACAGLGVVTVEVPVSAWTTASLAVAQDTALGTSVVSAASTTVLSSAALVDLQAMAVLGSVACGSDSGKASSSKMSYVLGPLRVGGGVEGVLIGNLVLLGAATAVQSAACAMLLLYRRRTLQKHRSACAVVALSAKPPPSSTSHAPCCDRGAALANDADVWSVLRAVRFPGLLWSTVGVLQQGMASQAATLALTGQLSAAGLLGLVVVVLYPASVLWGAQHYASASFDVDGQRLVFYKYEHVLDGVAPGTLLRRVASWVVPVGRWGPKEYSSSCGQPYSQLRPVWAAYALAAPLQGLLLGIVAALPVSASSPGLCGLQYGALGVIASVMGLSGALARPYRIPVTHWLQLVSSLTVLLAAVAYVGLLSSQAGGRAPDPWLWILAVSLMLQMCVTVVRALQLGAVKVLEAVKWHTDARTHVWVEGMVPHEVSSVRRDLIELLAGAPQSTAVDMQRTTSGATVHHKSLRAKASSAAAGLIATAVNVTTK